MPMNVKPIPMLDDEVNEVRIATADIVNKHILPVEDKLYARSNDGRSPTQDSIEEARELRNQVQKRVKEAKLWAPHLPPEFGGMGLEGAVKLGYRKDLEAINDPEEREQAYQNLVEKMYEAGKGLSMADHFEIDDVIDPQDSRQWVIAALRAAGPGEERASKKRPMIDTW